MKLLLVIAGLLGLTSLGSLLLWAWGASAKPPSEPAGPQSQGTVALVEPEIDFGRVDLGSKIRGSFTVVNNSGATVALKEVAKSCSCTSAELTCGELAPNGRADLRFEIKTGVLRGRRAETIMLSVSSGGQQLGTLAAKVLFEPTGIVTVEPSTVVLTRAESKVTLAVRIDSVRSQGKVLDAVSSHPCVRIDKTSLPLLHLELDTDALHESSIETKCVVYTSVPGEDEVSIPVRVRK